MNIWVHVSERTPPTCGFYQVADKVKVRNRHHFWDGRRWNSPLGYQVDYVEQWLDKDGDDHGDD